MAEKTFAEEIAEDAERLRRRLVHAARPKHPLSLDEAMDLHRKMETPQPPADE